MPVDNNQNIMVTLENEPFDFFLMDLTYTATGPTRVILKFKDGSFVNEDVSTNFSMCTTYFQINMSYVIPRRAYSSINKYKLLVMLIQPVTNPVFYIYMYVRFFNLANAVLSHQKYS